MRGISTMSFWIILIVFLVLEIIVIPGIKKTFPKTGKKFWGIYGLLFGILYLLFIWFYQFIDIRTIHNFAPYFYINALLLLFFLPKLTFSLFSIFYYILKLFHLIAPKNNVILYSGIIFSSVIFGVLFLGTVWGRNDLRVRTVEIPIDGLPKSFENFRIVQFSDLHEGTPSFSPFGNFKATKVIDRLHPDLIVFTGDLVNNFARETPIWFEYLKTLRASYGKYSILGNHDYGDYTIWPDAESKRENLNRLIRTEEYMGFHLLRNESVLIRNKQDSIALIGVENWGNPPFPRYGDLTKAMTGINQVHTKILLSHDPNHWKEEIKDKISIQLTLSGHTHGMQVGFFLNGLIFSPSALVFTYWGGLYKANNQFLYVNPGLGSLGFPGRVDMPAEITVLILKSKSHKN